MIRVSRRISLFALFTLLAVAVQPAAAVTIRMDYSTDTGGFFPPASQARATLEAVASFYNSILDDSLSAIQTPLKFQGSLGGEVTWNWTRSYTHPTSADFITNANVTIAANDYPIFVGARNLAGNTIGLGGPGSYGWERLPPNGNFSPQDNIDWMNIEAQFVSSVERRGEASGFALWGGAFTVDTVLPAGLSWHLDHTTPPSGGSKVDLYSVALHEIGHALGIGNISADPLKPTVWQTLRNAATHQFTGAEAVALYGGNVPLEADDRHWQNGLASKTFSGFVSQEVAMDPSLTNGTRKHITLLDAAALVDLGWEIDLPTPPAIVPGDYNGDGMVNAVDYTVWRNNLGDSTEADINFAGNGGGVSSGDYTYWKARYGNGMMSGGGGLAGAGSTAVPEPGTAALLLLGAFIAMVRGSRSSARRG